MNTREKKFLKTLGIVSAVVFAAVLFVEFFVLNFTPLSLISKKYQTVDLDLSSAKGFNIEVNEDGSLSLGNSYSSFEIENINRPVGSIGFDIEFKEGYKQKTLYVNYCDESASEYREGRAKITFDENQPEKHIMVCNFSGDVSRLQFIIQPGSADEAVIKRITLNEPMSAADMFGTAVLTLSLILLADILIFLFLGAEASGESFKKRRSFCIGAAAAITLCVMLYTLSISVGYADTHSYGVAFNSLSGNQITKELVDAFEHGQVSLLEQPSKELLALENPYDYEARQASGASFLWDHCLYNGKYYSYYGIGPVLALFLPYHLITGYYFPAVWAVMIFSMVGLFFLMQLYMAVIEKWFSDLPVNVVLMGLVTVLMGSGIFVNAARPLFYEIAISSGFACVAVGAWLLIESNILGGGKISYKKICLSSVFLGYAVLCRPTLAVYCAAALLFIAAGIKKVLSENPNIKKSKALIKYAAASLIPFAVFAIAQMVYNYLRFDNPLDFGIQYSLTINDFTHSEFSFKYLLIALWGYLFNMPHFDPSEFPFLASGVERFGLNGYIFIDDAGKNLVSTGIFFRALPIVSYFFAGKALKKLDKSKRAAAAVLIGVSCIIMPLVTIFPCWQSGYAVRYNADFSWQMIMGALMIAFTLYQHCKSENTRKLINIIFAVSTVLCVYVNAAQVFEFSGMILSF